MLNIFSFSLHCHGLQSYNLPGAALQKIPPSAHHAENFCLYDADGRKISLTAFLEEAEEKHPKTSGGTERTSIHGRRPCIEVRPSVPPNRYYERPHAVNSNQMSVCQYTRACLKNHALWVQTVKYNTSSFIFFGKAYIEPYNSTRDDHAQGSYQPALQR